MDPALGLYSNQVQSGAHILDGVDPDWPSRIDLGRLVSSWGTNDILSQLFGSFEEGKKQLSLSETSAQSSGFTIGFLGCLFEFITIPLLVAAWTLEIESRLHRRAAA